MAARRKGRRAGTENLPGIVGCGLAMELAEVHRAERVAYVGALRDRLYQGLCEGISGLQLNGDAAAAARQPEHIHPDIDGEALLLRLTWRASRLRRGGMYGRHAEPIPCAESHGLA